MKKLLLISGWAYDAQSLAPLSTRLADSFETTLLSGAELLKTRTLPEADYLLGWSMGGMLALELLPPSCQKLILLSSTARFCATANYPCGIPEKALRRMILQLKRAPEAVLAQFHKSVLHPQENADHLSPPTTTENLIDGLTYLLETDLRSRIPQITIPTLILHGAEDQIIPVSAAHWLTEKLPNATSHSITAYGHHLPPEQLLPAIQHFL